MNSKEDGPDQGIVAMTKTALEVPEPVRRRALAEGQAGEAWLAGLAGAVGDLAIEWDLSIGRTLSGGTEAFVAEVTRADGREAVLKLRLPERDGAADELRTLLAVRGHGYADIYRHDQARGALLLERLGPKLSELGLPVDTQIEIICTTLRAAWAPRTEGAGLTTGAAKARSLGDFIETTWLELGRPCPERIIEVALRYAEARRRDFDPDSAVLAHGDAHAWNTLLVPGAGSGRFKLVDPDGLLIERAYDLGILMREWTSELMAGDPMTLGRRRCRLLSERAGVDAEPIWQWGFIERTSTALLCMKIGWEEGARDMLAVADAWARGLGR